MRMGKRRRSKLGLTPGDGNWHGNLVRRNGKVGWIQSQQFLESKLRNLHLVPAVSELLSLSFSPLNA